MWDKPKIKLSDLKEDFEHAEDIEMKIRYHIKNPPFVYNASTITVPSMGQWQLGNWQNQAGQLQRLGQGQGFLSNIFGGVQT